MSGQQNSQADAILASISGVLEDLTTLEKSYKVTKEQKVADLAAYLKRLAETADTQAVRARVLRDLYWYKRIPALTLTEPFGLKQGEVRRIAGHMVVELPCGRSICQNKTKVTHTSLHQLESFEKQLSAPDGPGSLRCKECEERDRRAREEDDRRRDAERRLEAQVQRRRDETLATLPWQTFIETTEWVAARNTAIDESGYACGLCKSGGVSLYVYLAKDQPQYSTDLWFKLSSHLHVLCADCLPRLTGLLDEQKYELVKKEFLGHIEEWARDNIQYPY